MSASNELSIFHGGDTWEAVKKAIELAIAQPSGTFTEVEETDLNYVYEAMQEIERR